MKNQLKTIVLMGSLSALVLGVGNLVAPGSLYIFAALALAMNLGAYYFADRFVLRMHGARELVEQEAPGLHAMVDELATRAGIPKPRLFLISDAQPNAFATGRNPQHGVVAITDGLLRLLDRREVRGVLAHEIAHIKNRDILLSSIAAAGAAFITYLAQALSFSLLFGGNRDDDDETSGSSMLVALVAPLAATLIQLGISRSREYLADETGARLTGDPRGLATALLKLDRAAALLPNSATPATASLFIVNPFGSVQRLAGWFSTHPETAERVARLKAMAGEQRRRRVIVRRNTAFST